METPFNENGPTIENSLVVLRTPTGKLSLCANHFAYILHTYEGLDPWLAVKVATENTPCEVCTDAAKPASNEPTSSNQ